MTLRSVESGPLVVGQASTASATGCWNLESSLALGVYADASVAPITQTISARTFIPAIDRRCAVAEKLRKHGALSADVLE